MITNPQNRLISLDILRGITVIGMIFVNTLSGVTGTLHTKTFEILEHERWQGIHIADLVFPAFLMMLGISIPMALAKTKAQYGLNTIQSKRIFWRAFRLIALGFILTNLGWFAHFSSATWRLFGVLQRIGLVYGICAVLFFKCTPRTRIIILVIILLLYWPMALLPTLDHQPSDIWIRGHNFIASFDRIILGAGHHNYIDGPDGYDPEGFLGTLPCIAHALIGVAIGEYFLRNQNKNISKTLALTGLAMFFVGLAWGVIFPIVKDIWSSSFVLVTCGFTTVVLAGLHYVLDGENRENFLINFCLAFGVNAIAAYILHDIFADGAVADIITFPYYWTRPYIGEAWAVLLPVILFILCISIPLQFMQRKKWILKI